MSKPIVLTCVDHYLPGYKAGGPVRSIANMVEVMGDEFQFNILTTDRDLGDVEPYPHIESGQWKTVGKARVLYLTPQQKRLPAWQRLLNQLNCDVLYLNGYFSPLSVETLWLRKWGQISPPAIVLAPRGEFSPGALTLKVYKKRPYLWASNKVALHQDIIWHASTPYEAEDIQRVISGHATVVTARPIIEVTRDPAWVPSMNSLSLPKKSGELQIVFVSRVSRKKNLDVALQFLKKVQGVVNFDVYGPLEDLTYWRECEHLIAELPAHIQVHYKGILTPAQVPQVFAASHLFLFPTKGENFGHVIVEALTAGCPVLLSDQTPWRGLEKIGVGWDIPLTEPERFQAVLNRCVTMGQAEFERWSIRARHYACSFIQGQQQQTIQAYRALFSGAK